MGIRFLCPNGHQLNVKTFLAGKRAICPKCGVKLIVPKESSAADQTSSVEGEIEMAMAETSEAPPEAEGPPSQPIPTQVASQPLGADRASADASPAPRLDILEEAPNAVWYVAPKDADQLGPIDPQAVRGWIVEGRIAADSLVWRQDWPDWRRADEVFEPLRPVPKDASEPVSAGRQSAPPIVAPPPPSEPRTTPSQTTEPRIASPQVAPALVASQPPPGGTAEPLEVAPIQSVQTRSAPETDPPEKKISTSRRLIEQRRRRSDRATIISIVILSGIAVVLLIACLYVVLG